MKRIEKSYDKENYNRKYINGKDKCFSQNRFTQIVKIRKKINHFQIQRYTIT